MGGKRRNKPVYYVFAVITAGVIAGGTLLSGCGNQNAPSTNSARSATSDAPITLTLLSPHSEEIRKEFGDAFEGWHLETHRENLNVKWMQVGGGGTSSLLRYLRTNLTKSPKGIGIDIFWGGGIDPYLELDKDGFLVSHTPPESISENLPDTILELPMFSKAHTWHGAALSGFGIAFNKVILADLGLPTPREWADLTDRRYNGWLELTDPRQSGSAHMMFEIILQAYGWNKGWEILTQMASNAKKFTRGGADAVQDVANGNAAAAPSIDFYALTLVNEVGDNIMGFVYPEKLTVINPDAIAILKGAPQLDAAKKFVNFVLSDNGQKLWMLPKGTANGPEKFVLRRMSVLPHLYNELGSRAVVKTNPFMFASSFKFDSNKSATRWHALNALLGTWLIDTHSELKQVWIHGNSQPSEPPIGEELLSQYASKWHDSEFAAAQEAAWARAAKSKYKAMAAW